jgi:hypothetical protein
LAGKNLIPFAKASPCLRARLTAEIAKGIILRQMATGFMIDPGIEAAWIT